MVKAVYIRASVLLCLLFFICSCSGIPSEDRLKDYREISEPVIVWLNNYHKENGRYPEALPDSIFSQLEKVDAPVRYRRSKSYFEIEIGNYSRRYPFVYYYSSGKWLLDT